MAKSKMLASFMDHPDCAIAVILMIEVGEVTEGHIDLPKAGLYPPSSHTVARLCRYGHVLMEPTRFKSEMGNGLENAHT